jgi:hypothetical protein
VPPSHVTTSREPATLQQAAANLAASHGGCWFSRIERSLRIDVLIVLYGSTDSWGECLLFESADYKPVERNKPPRATQTLLVQLGESHGAGASGLTSSVGSPAGRAASRSSAPCATVQPQPGAKRSSASSNTSSRGSLCRAAATMILGARRASSDRPPVADTRVHRPAPPARSFQRHVQCLRPLAQYARLGTYGRSNCAGDCCVRMLIQERTRMPIHAD